MTRNVSRVSWIASAIVLLGSGAADWQGVSVLAQDYEPRAPRAFSEEELEALESELLDDEGSVADDTDGQGDEGRGFRRFLPRWRGGDVHERNHRSVRAAFREVVGTARQATVQVLCDHERVAMGTIVDANGFVLTKASEVKGDVECRLVDGRRFPAEIVHVDDELDLAILKIEVTGLVPVAWRSEGVPVEGSWLATTSTQELPSAVGVVSVAPRPVPMPRAVLGIMLGDSSDGTLITNVVPESAAEEAGLEVDDVVLQLDGQAVPSSSAFVQAIRQKRPGQKVQLRIRREGEPMTITATLQEVDSLAQGRRVSFQNSLGGRLSTRRWGFPSVIQHDTVLRPSDCGGPIVDLDGYAVGINIARAGRVASYALPVEVLQPLMNDLRTGKFGSVLAQTSESRLSRIAELRLSVQEWTQQFADLQQQLEQARGVLPVADSAADSADTPAIAKLELAAEHAKSELDKALRLLQQLETSDVTQASAN